VPGAAVLPAPGRGRGGGIRASSLPARQPFGLPVFAAPPQPPAPTRGGSNNWTLSGAHSLDGHPILANDPHLQFQIPGLWWTVELSTPQWQAAGVAITGVPGIIIGHNAHLAWGVTNTRADVQDLYRERLDGRGHVLTSHGWRPLEHWHEHIAVRGAPAVDLDLQVTPHGPIVAHDAGGALALDWTLYAPGALQSTHVFLGIEQATNWDQFEAALASFPGPTQNFVYADTAGHIAYQCAGWVPLRRGSDGSVPLPGNEAAYDWQGWIPFAQLPRVLDPASGVIATANSRITADGYPYVISTDWDAPNRTRRAYQRLGELPRWNASAMGRVQQDVSSEQDRDFAQAVVTAGATPAAAGRGILTQRALALLRGFRGAMGATSLAPTLAYFTRDEFLHRVLAAKVGDAMARQYNWDAAPVFEQWLLATRPAPWLPPGYAAPRGGGWDGLLLDSLDAVAERYTLEANKLRWGGFETLQIDHPVYSRIPLLNRVADLGPVPINGSPLTLKQARNTALGDPNDLGPSMRFVADLGDWDRSTLTLV
ncbi:MAG: penicillin acylase family protein, partial [Terriglobales bacterium]